MFGDRNYIIIVGKGASDQVGKLPVKEILGLVVGSEQAHLGVQLGKWALQLQIKSIVDKCDLEVLEIVGGI